MSRRHLAEGMRKRYMQLESPTSSSSTTDSDTILGRKHTLLDRRTVIQCFNWGRYVAETVPCASANALGIYSYASVNGGPFQFSNFPLRLMIHPTRVNNMYACFLSSNRFSFIFCVCWCWNTCCHGFSCIVFDIPMHDRIRIGPTRIYTFDGVRGCRLRFHQSRSLMCGSCSFVSSTRNASASALAGDKCSARSCWRIALSNQFMNIATVGVRMLSVY